MTMIDFKKNTACLFMGLLLSLPAIADELTDRQYSVTQAQKKYDLERARYDAATVLVNEQQQRVAEDQALLKDRRNKQSAAKAAMAKAKANLDSENRQLQQVWSKRNR